MGEAIPNAASLLILYATRKASLSLRDLVVCIVHAEQVRPSLHDERFQELVERVMSQRDELSLSALVDISKALQSLRLHGELTKLASLVVDNASFLSTDVIMSFAKTLALAHRTQPQEVTEKMCTPVFRILGEHIGEAMFEAKPAELAESLLAIAMFYCRRKSAALDERLQQPWHGPVFASSVDVFVREAPAMPPSSLVKCLLAYRMVLLSPRPSGKGHFEASLGEEAIGSFLQAVCAALRLQLVALPARELTRALHSLALLRRHGVVFRLGAEEEAFCAEAAEELRRRVPELGLPEICFTLQSMAFLTEAGLAVATAPVLQQLYREVQRHIPALTLDWALMIVCAAQRMAHIRAPGAVMELLAAEVQREERSLEPKHLCDAIVGFSALRYHDDNFFQGLGGSYLRLLPKLPARQLSVSLHGLSKLVLKLDPLIYEHTVPEVTKALVGYDPRDCALILWSFAKAAQKSRGLFTRVQDHLKTMELSAMSPADISMTLWSCSAKNLEVDPRLLSYFAQRVSGCGEFSDEALLVTCLAFTRLGFAQQPVLVQLYRSLYARLPRLSNAQLAVSFLLFSTSGVRDEALLTRFLYECGERLPRLRGQDLGNVMLASSRMVEPASLAAQYSLAEPLREHVLREVRNMRQAPLLGVLLSAPSLLQLPSDDCVKLLEVADGQLPNMNTSELVRCLLAVTRMGTLHRPFLDNLCLRLRDQRDTLSPSDVVSCVYAIHSLGSGRGYYNHKFRRSLRGVLSKHTRLHAIPARTIRDVLPAVGRLGMWRRLPESLRRSVWKMASDDLRQYVDEPPPKPEWVAKDKAWRLPSISKDNFRRRGRMLSRAQLLESVAEDLKAKELQAKAEERKVQEQVGAQVTGTSATQDFVTMIRRL